MPRISFLSCKRMLWLLSLTAGGAALGWGYVLVRGRVGGSPAGPRLEKVDDAILNLGEGKPGDVLTGYFALRNRGAEPLEFQIRASCNCAQLQPRKGRIEPGEVQEVVAGVRLRSEGVRERVRLSILTNDPQTPQAEYVLEANCPAPFDVSPSLIDFGSVGEGESREAILTVRDGHGAPLAATTDLRWSVANPYVSVEPAKGGEQERQLAVRLLPTAPRGHLQAEVTLALAGVESPMHVPVTAYIVGQVLAAPQTLILSPGGEAKLLVWRPDGKPLGALRQVDAGQGLAVDEVLGRGATRRAFRVRTVGPVRTGESHHIRLRFERLFDEVVISVQVGKPARE